MPQIINTNVSSLNAQRNLNRSQSELQISLQRLSSGLRINSAKDDAAGLAISDRFTTQIRGINQAARNANDGISLAQTGEGALAEVSNNLQRIRELAVQATNSTNSADDRAAINLEVQQRLAEIDRTASQTSFNGTKLLDGSFGNASFQIGANVGETISIGLQTNVRLAGTGRVASTTSATLGASATDGHIDVTSTNLNYGTAAAAATSGRVTFTATTYNFAAATAYVAGTSSPQSVVDGTNFSLGSVQVDGTNAQTYTTASGTNSQTVAGWALDASGGGGPLNFTVDGQAVSINGDYSGGAVGDWATFLSDINADLTGITASGAAGSLTFTRDAAGATQAIALTASNAAAQGIGITDSSGTGTVNTDVFDFSGAGLAQFDVDGIGVTLNADYTNAAGLATAIQSQLTGYTVAASAPDVLTITKTGSTAAVAITAADVNAVAAGFANTAGTAGSAAVASTAATMTIDGVNITLNGNDANRAAIASELQTKMQASALGAGYTATVNGSNQIVITNATGGTATTAVAITNVDANAAAAGFSNSSGVAGTAAAAGNPASVTIGGTAITLDQNYGSWANLTAAISTAMGGSYNVTNTNGTITVARTSTGAASTAVAITGSDANATTAGIANAAGTAGTDAVASTNGTFYVDGTAVTLDQNYADQDAVAADIQSQLTGYTASNTAGVITISKTNSQAAVQITGADANATAGGFGYATGVAGVSGGSITLANFGINGTSLVGTYASTTALATAINSKVSNVYAEIVSGALKLTSSADISLGGAEATGSMGFAAATATANSGDLSTANTLTVADANTTIQRIDNALSTVSSLRSTFGAIQNRFDSVIASLNSTSENLTAARSRIQDADFAAETATLTRNQILQQAGIAMLSQANASPQSVLSLLQG